MATAPRFIWVLLATTLAQGLATASPGLRAQDVGAWALVQGRVVEYESGLPLEGAVVTLTPDTDDPSGSEVRISDTGGTFGFSELPPGTYLVSVSLIGYTSLRDTLVVGAAALLDVTLPISVSPVVLKPIVVVVSRRPVGPLVGFETRRQTIRGTFITREDIEESGAFEFTDLVRTIPGVRLVPTGSFGHRLFFRGGCTPDLWLDGIQVTATGDIDSFLRPEDLEAVEVYRGPELPGEFGSNACGAIVAWTLRGRPAPEKKSLKRQLVYAASLALMFLLVR